MRIKPLRHNLVVQFSAVSFVALGLLLVTEGVVTARTIKEDAAHHLTDEVVAIASGRLLQAITPADTETVMTGDRYNQFDRFVKQSIVSERTARVNIWARDGTITYSSDPSKVGLKFPDDEHLKKALRGQTVYVQEPAEGDKPNDAADEFVEVYTPIVFPGTTEPQGAFEVYQYYAPTGRLVAAVHGRVLVSLGVGFLVVYLVLVGIVWRGWQTIRRQESALIASERLASIGQLASGVAHELNNPLTSVIGFSELMMDKDMAPEVKKNLQIVHDEAQRTAKIVKNLLGFVRQQEQVKQPLNLNSILEKVLAVRAYEQKASNIRVVTRFTPDLPEVMADPSQMQQVFFNLVINAEHFMVQAHQGGTLTVATEREGSVAQASVTDDGPGIAKENISRLFTPFFTTKEVGKGTGLGLSICYGIVTQHGGRIFARSEPGKGATFVVELPITTR